MTPAQKRVFRIFEKGVFFGIFLIAICGGAIFGFTISEISGGREMKLLLNYRPATLTRLYDRNGKIFAELFRQRQELIKYQNIPRHIIKTFLAVEDDNFFNHIGIDLMGIMRAAVKNVLAGKIVQGGSTLTQQVAKQIYLNSEGVRKRTFWQKIRETIMALRIEEELSKEEILEVYFNIIYLGHGCQGIACASRLYFDKRVEELTMPEAALLARLPKAPVNFSPFKNPRAAMEQQKYTFKRMAALNYLSVDEIEPIHENFWKVYWGKFIVRSPSQTTWAEKMDLAPYFTDYVRQILEATDRVGPKRLYTQGLQVYTTLDLHHQLIADDEMKKKIKKANKFTRHYRRSAGSGGVDRNLFNIFRTISYILPVGSIKIKGLSEKGHLQNAIKNDLLDAGQLLSLLVPATNEAAAFEEYRKDTRTFFTNLEIQGAFLGIEPSTGYITSMIGGAKFSPQNQYNRALRARRQPGSAFKIFVYGAALENRIISSNSALNDAPFFTIAPNGSSWEPVNYSEGFRGLVPATKALAYSLNICAIEVFFKTGPGPIIDLASRLMKITNPNRFTPDPALALGVSEVTPMEMATAVSIIANDGKDVIPFAIRYVTDASGTIIYNKEDQIRRILAKKMEQKKIQIIEPGLAFILRKMMAEVADRGTASSYIRDEAKFSGNVSVKTGTTSGWTDAWIVGFNPEYSTVIWIGFDKKLTMGRGGSGSPMVAPVLGNFYRRIYSGKKSAYPRFKDRPDKNKKPAGVGAGNCGGYTLKPKIIRGKIRRVINNICAAEEHRIYDMRTLLMKKMEITPEDIGEKRKVRFKAENY